MMNEAQRKEFSIIVERCKQERTSEINVPRLVWGDVIIAASIELEDLRILLRRAVTLFEYDGECSDPSNDDGKWFRDVQKTLKGRVVE